MVAVNGIDSKDVIKKYVDENKFTFQIALAGKNGGKEYKVADQYGVMAYPTNYLIDAKGKVLWRGVGFDEKAIRAALEKAGVK